MCKWYSYHSNTERCNLAQNCKYWDRTEKCVSGQRECYITTVTTISQATTSTSTSQDTAVTSTSQATTVTSTSQATMVTSTSRATTISSTSQATTVASTSQATTVTSTSASPDSTTIETTSTVASQNTTSLQTTTIFFTSTTESPNVIVTLATTIASLTMTILPTTSILLDTSTTTKADTTIPAMPPTILVWGTNNFSTMDLTTNARLDCNIPDYPVDMFEGAVATYLIRNSVPIILICGGTNNHRALEKGCFEYHGTGNWIQSDLSLPPDYQSSGFADRVTKFLAFDNNKIWALGPAYSVNYLHDGSEWVSDPPQPPMSGQYCGLQLNATHMMITGGTIDGQVTNQVYFYNWMSEKWSEGPSLHNPFSDHLCTSDGAGGR